MANNGVTAPSNKPVEGGEAAASKGLTSFSICSILGLEQQDEEQQDGKAVTTALQSLPLAPAEMSGTALLPLAIASTAAAANAVPWLYRGGEW